MKTLQATLQENLIGKHNLLFLIAFVAGFFALSGFVITSANDAHGEKNLSAAPRIIAP